MEIKIFNKDQFKLFVKLSFLLGLISYVISLTSNFSNLKEFVLLDTILYIITAFFVGAIPGIVLKNIKITMICGSSYSAITLLSWMYLKSSGENTILNLGPTIIYLCPPIVLGFVWGLLISNYKKHVALMSLVGGVLGYFLGHLPDNFFSIISGLVVVTLDIFEFNPNITTDVNFVMSNLNSILRPFIGLYFILLLSSISMHGETKQIFKDLLSFKGYINRKKYVQWWLFYFFLQLSIYYLTVAFLLTYVFELELANIIEYDFSSLIYSIVIYLIIYLFFTLILFSLTVKRLNDLNKTYWYLLLGILPIANLYLLYLLLMRKGKTIEI
jgi:uncharacterized membrane protein YhaH (DUF805 family)